MPLLGVSGNQLFFGFPPFITPMPKYASLATEWAICASLAELRQWLTWAGQLAPTFITGSALSREPRLDAILSRAANNPGSYRHTYRPKMNPIARQNTVQTINTTHAPSLSYPSCITPPRNQYSTDCPKCQIGYSPSGGGGSLPAAVAQLSWVSQSYALPMMMNRRR